MSLRHINRIRSSLSSDRRAAGHPREIESFEVPSVKIGRYVDFGQSPDFGEYYESLQSSEGNQRGLHNGWFDFASPPIFVEYADLTPGLENMLSEKSRSRTFGREVTKTVTSLRDDLRETAHAAAKTADELNAVRQAAIRKSIEDGDHAEEIAEYGWLHEAKSAWGPDKFGLSPQPRLTPSSTGDGILYTYGFPVIQGRSEQDLSQGITELVRTQGLPVPDQLLKARRPVVPVVRLYSELSAMGREGPVLPRPPSLTLGPIEVHRF